MTRSSVIVITSQGVRAGLVTGTAALGGHMACTLVPKLLVDGASPEGILGVGVGVCAAAGVGLGVTLVRSAIAETRRMLSRLTTPPFDGDLASRGVKLLLAGVTAGPAMLLASVAGGELTPALLAGGFMGFVAAGVGGMAAQVASMRALRDQRDAAFRAGDGSGAI